MQKAGDYLNLRTRKVGCTLAVCYSEPNKFTLFKLNDGADPEYIGDVDDIIWKFDTAISAKENKFSIAHDINTTLMAFKRKQK